MFFLRRRCSLFSFMSILHVRGVSEKFRHIANRYNIKTFFKMRNTLRNSLMRIRPISSPREVNVTSYTGETGILWPV